jgi:hypothetical protein
MAMITLALSTMPDRMMEVIQYRFQLIGSWWFSVVVLLYLHKLAQLLSLE